MAIEYARIDDALAALDDATSAQDASAIIAASEALAAAVSALNQGQVRASDPASETRLISAALAKLEAAAMKINLLANWNRQRIDALANLRSGHGFGRIITY